MGSSINLEVINTRSAIHILLLSVFVWFVIDGGREEIIGLMCIFAVVAGISLLPKHTGGTERMTTIVMGGLTVVGGGSGLLLILPDKTLVSVLLVCIAVWLFLDRFVSASNTKDTTDDRGHPSRSTDSGKHLRAATLLSVRFVLERATKPLTARQISESVGVSETRISRLLGALSSDGVVIENGGRYWLNTEQRRIQTWIPVGLTIAKRRIIRPFKQL